MQEKQDEAHGKIKLKWKIRLVHFSLVIGIVIGAPFSFITDDLIYWTWQITGVLWLIFTLNYATILRCPNCSDRIFIRTFHFFGKDLSLLFPAYSKSCRNCDFKFD